MTAKQFCKDNKLKFERVISPGIVLGSEIIPVNAGMETNLITGKFTPGGYKIQAIGKRRIYSVYDYHNIQLLESFKSNELSRFIDTSEL